MLLRMQMWLNVTVKAKLISNQSGQRSLHLRDLLVDLSSFQLASHTRPQRPSAFWTAPRITTSGLSLFSEHAQIFVSCSQPIRFVRFHGKSVNHEFQEMYQPAQRLRFLVQQTKGARPLGTRILTLWPAYV